MCGSVALVAAAGTGAGFALWSRRQRAKRRLWMQRAGIADGCSGRSSKKTLRSHEVGAPDDLPVEGYSSQALKVEPALSKNIALGRREGFQTQGLSSRVHACIGWCSAHTVG